MKHHDMHPATKRLRNKKMVSIALFVTSSQAPNHQLKKVQNCGISFLSFPHRHTHTHTATIPTKKLLATIQC